MKKKLSFWAIFGIWLVVDLAVLVINGTTVRSPLLVCAAQASLGVVLLFYPVYPKQLEAYYSPEKAVRFIRILAVVEILVSFATRLDFFS